MRWSVNAPDLCSYEIKKAIGMILNKMGKFSEGLLYDETILANLNIYAGQTILNAGCGNGYMAKKFLKLVGNTGKIYALDPDKGSIAS